MKDELKIILVEDNPSDAKILCMELKKYYHIYEQRVETKEEYINALNKNKADIILSDYSLPQFNGMDALSIRQEMAPEIPFILITGSLSEETAVEIMKSGADDYILKENLNRLVPAVKAALEKSRIVREKILAEIALKDNEKKYHLIVDNIPSVVIIHTENEILFANPAAVRVFGANSLEQILKKNILEYVLPGDREEIIKRIQKGYSEGITSDLVERKLLRFDGKILFTETTSLPIQYMGQNAVQTIIRDITERKINEEKLKTLIRAVEQNPTSIIITLPDGLIEYVNPKFTEITGYSPDEVMGKNPRILKSGDMPVEKYKELWNTILSGRTWYGEFHNRKKSGELYWENATISPIVDNKHTITHFVAVKEDITEKKKLLVELTSAKEKAEESNKLKSEFLAQMSHEIRSPMNAIINFMNLAREDLGYQFTSDVSEYFDGADAAGKRLVRTVELILNVSEVNVGAYQPTWQKIDIIEEIWRQLQSEYSSIAKQKGIEFSMEYCVSSVTVYGDKYSLNQILANIIDNAIKFTEKGSVKVYLKNNIENNIEITIEDTGIGISEDFLKHIYEPFMQEKRGYSREYEGNGLGMPLAKKYCEINNINIDIVSAKKKGTKVTLTFQNQCAHLKK
jgi:PAS domain S-box-containing protein